MRLSPKTVSKNVSTTAAPFQPGSERSPSTTMGPETRGRERGGGTGGVGSAAATAESPAMSRSASLVMEVNVLSRLRTLWALQIHVRPERTRNNWILGGAPLAPPTS